MTKFLKMWIAIIALNVIGFLVRYHEIFFALWLVLLVVTVYYMIVAAREALS